MKPSKIVNIVMLLLLCFIVIYLILLNTCSIYINTEVIDKIFSFIFPTFIFFLFWCIGYRRQNEKISISKYYLKVVINVVLPYFICMLPYIIYEYGMNNLESDNLLRLLITGDFSKQFIFIRTIVSLLIVYPFIEWFVKSNKKVAIIFSFILSAISNLFHFDVCFISDILNYLVYMTIGISFAKYGKETTLFLRNSRKNYIYYIVEIVILMYITAEFEAYKGMNSLVSILYNILIIILISYLCYRYRMFYKNIKFLLKDYLFDSITFNPALVVVSVFLLSNIIITLIEDCINMLISNFKIELVYNMAILVFILIFLIMKSITVGCYKKNRDEL